MMSRKRLIAFLTFLSFGGTCGKLRSDVTIRANRFPSMEERVKLYMGNWYLPPCVEHDDGYVHYEFLENSGDFPTLQIEQLRHHRVVKATLQFMNLESIILPDYLFYMDPDTIRNCANLTLLDPRYQIQAETDARALQLYSRVKFRSNMRMYCHDVQDSLLTAWYHVNFEHEKANRVHDVPILLQFGDNRESHQLGAIMLPHMKKFRSAVKSPEALAKATESSTECSIFPRNVLDTKHYGENRLQPIIWKLATHRHYERLYEVYRNDVSWESKRNMAVFRGQLTGSRDGYIPSSSDEENCHRLKRCRLVIEHANSNLVDAKLTSTRNRLKDSVQNVTLVGGKYLLDQLLEFKGIVMLEGNDVASGLKWALLSQSVVLMPIPRHTSWAMEELLEPWVHFVPINEYGSDLEERMQWVLDNDSMARRISERATLWMEDLVFHPDAAEDDRLIQEEIVRRYQAHFRPQRSKVQV